MFGKVINGLKIRIKVIKKTVNGKKMNGTEMKDGKKIKRGYKPNPRLGNLLLNLLSSYPQFKHLFNQLRLLNLLVQFEYWTKELNRIQFKHLVLEVKINRKLTHSTPSGSMLQRASSQTR